MEEGLPVEPTNGQPGAPAAPAPAIDAQLERAIAAHDAREHQRALEAKPLVTPFSLSEVDRRVWIAVGVLVLLLGLGLGGAPWKAGFWIALAFCAAAIAPFAAFAVFLWQRER